MTDLDTTTKANAAALVNITDEQIAAMSDADLTAFLGKVLYATAELIALAGRVYRVRLASGKEMPALVGIWKTYLPLVASGAVLPATVATLASYSTVLKAVAALPIEQQQRLIDGEPINVCERNPRTGAIDFTKLRVSDLRPAHVKLVFGDRTIRSEAEQRAIITADVSKPKSAPPIITAGNFKIDRAAGVLLVGRTRVDLDTLSRALIEAGYVSPK